MNSALMNLDDIKKGLADKRLYKVSEITGLSYPTLKKMADGKNSNYTMSTIAKVSEYLNSKEQRS